MDEPTLRSGSPADVPALADLVNRAYGHYIERLGGPPRPMTDDYAEVVREDLVIVAEREGEIIGLLVLAIDDEACVIDNVAVDPAHRGTGVGRLLLERAEAEARAAGFESINLYTHEKLVESLELYRRIGYVEYERRPYGDAQIVYLRKQLDDPTGSS